MEYYREKKPHFTKRILWFAVNRTLFRLCSFGAAASIGRSLLRLFGAKMGHRSMVYGTANVFAPWNLVVEDHSCIGPHVNVYNKAKIIVHDHCVVSQGVFLCTASHDYASHDHALITKPIEIGSNAWIAADAFVGMGVCIGNGAVVGARAVVFKDVESWTVVGGNPACFIKKRVMK